MYAQPKIFLKPFLLLSALLVLLSSSAQELKYFEESFSKNNLMLLAEHYRIEMSKAAVIQAKIWDLPYINTELNAFNPDANKAFDLDKNGQKTLQIQQLIYLGNKKKYEVDFARSQITLSELQFEDLLRKLKFSLRSSFYSAYYEKKKLEVTQLQLNNLDTLIKAFQIQVEKGNISIKDLVRLQTLYLSLSMDKLEITKLINTYEATIKIIAGIKHDINPVFMESLEISSRQKPLPFSKDSLLSLACDYRPDYKYNEVLIDAQNKNLTWQRALAVPDMTIGASYDQRGGAFNNQINLTLGMPLYLWNTNKGQIKIAEFELEQAKVQKDVAKQNLQSEISLLAEKFELIRDNFIKNQNSNMFSFDEVYQGVMSNFFKRNISMLEFTDYLESYQTSVQQVNELKKQLIIAAEELNSALNYSLL